jgi:hypothetical protein
MDATQAEIALGNGKAQAPLETVIAGPISGIEPAGAGLLPVSTLESEDTHHV